MKWWVCREDDGRWTAYARCQSVSDCKCRAFGSWAEAMDYVAEQSTEATV